MLADRPFGNAQLLELLEPMTCWTSGKKMGCKKPAEAERDRVGFSRIGVESRRQMNGIGEGLHLGQRRQLVQEER